MKKEPAPHEINKSKKVNNREYWWCKTHKSWVRHKDSECKGLGIKTPQNTNKPTSPNTSLNDNAMQRLKLSKALETVMEGDGE